MGDVSAYAKTKTGKSSITLEKKSLETYVGGTVKLKVKAVKNAPKAKLTYKSSNKKIATDSAKGEIKGRKKELQRLQLL